MHRLLFSSSCRLGLFTGRRRVANLVPGSAHVFRVSSSPSMPWTNQLSTSRRSMTTPSHPVTPNSNSNSSTPRWSTPRTRHYKRVGYLVLGLTSIYLWDKHYNASSITRNLRTLWISALITLDYKINFTPEKTEQIPQLHERVADRVYHLLTSNGGLYIKIGQAIGANAALLPKPLQLKFASLFDDAPQIPYSTIHSVFQREFGGRAPSGPTPATGVFEVFEEKAVASASIAQVHRAKVWGKDEWVAVKVQKPDVGMQMEWDLAAYRAVMWMFENWAFGLPVYFAVDFIADHLRQELDFEREAENARKTAVFVENEPRLRGKVYIPKVYPEYSTKRIMTAEYIEGVRLSDRKGIRRLMGERERETDGDDYSRDRLLSSSTPLPGAPPLAPDTPLPSPPPEPRTTFTYPQKPLKGGLKSIMQTMVELFSAQMFSWGWVHCDPHPGNVLIRPLPSDPTRAQLVLIDHGLYVQVPEGFRREWVKLWRGMLSGDFGQVEEVTKGWGIGMPDLMASFTLMRPVVLRRGRKKKKEESEEEKERKRQEQEKPLTQYEVSVRMKEKLRGFLEDTEKMPKELIFLTRNMRMVQGNNQSLGSPVNRVKITGYWASRSQIGNRSLGVRERLREMWRHVIFRAVMFWLDVAFWKNKLLSWVWDVRRWLMGSSVRRKRNFEEELEENMRELAREGLGIEVGEGVFSG